MPRTPTQHLFRCLTAVLGTATLGIMMYAFGVLSVGEHPTALKQPLLLEGRLLPVHLRPELNQEWVTIHEDEIRTGVSIPAHRHVLIEIPEEIDRISRHTLLGRKGASVRYWGGCSAPPDRRGQRQTTHGFLATLFLSEKERAVRDEEQLKRRRRSMSILEQIEHSDLNDERPARGRIRHQQEIFEGGQTCYVMTEEPLPIGTDEDGDGANASVERDFGSDPKNPDSDGDGVTDGLEIFRLGTHPKRRDSDGDGLLDGIEDKNHNGSWDMGETNPTEWDTDNDGLCDGLCRVNRGRELRGEDKNLNGEFEPDSGDYNPLARDTDGDGTFDLTEYLNCIAANGENC